MFHQQNRNVKTKFPGGYSAVDTPVPIPNTEVKHCSADGTVWETAWESRSSPGLILKKVCQFFESLDERESERGSLKRTFDLKKSKIKFFG